MRFGFPSLSVLFVLVGGLSSSHLIAAEPANGKDPIRDAVKKGAEYLIAVHQPNPGYAGGSNGIGTACLAGMALLESGIDEKNASLDNIARYVRANCLSQTGTYQVSLCIMFLDRLGHPEDRPFIQFLGVRLMGGQTGTGGWSYDCGYPLTPQEEAMLRNSYTKESRLTNSGTRPDGEPEPKKEPKKTQPRPDLPEANPPKKETPKPTKPVETPTKSDRPVLNPEANKLLNIVLDPRNAKPNGGFGGLLNGDNSNTQFAALGLWVARKHGVPVEKCMGALEKRFRGTQRPDGAWDYMAGLGRMVPMEPKPAMTCAGLISLAVSYGATEVVLRNKPEGQAPARKNNNRIDPGDDEAIKMGLKALGAFITRAKGDPEGRIMPGARGRRRFQIDALNSDLYFLWSLERTAVIYGLETIGNHDWYVWGSDSLVDSQQPNGSWTNGGYPGANADVNTPFALLFLNRANVAKDLTASLNGKVKDPGVSILKGGGDLSKIIPGLKKDPAKGTDTPNPVNTTDPMTGTKLPDPTSNPNQVAPDFDTQAGQLVQAVVAASGAKRTELLAKLRDTKGAVNTEALSRCATKLTGEGQTEAREALARRLTRMTATTLREMLIDDNREIRAAAATACGFKDDKQYVPDLITALADKEALVTSAAQTSLKRLTSKEFGSNANAWRNWWKTQKN